MCNNPTELRRQTFIGPRKVNQKSIRMAPPKKIVNIIKEAGLLGQKTKEYTIGQTVAFKAASSVFLVNKSCLVR